MRADGTGEPRAVNRLALSNATTVLAPDGSVRVSYGIRRGRDFASARARIDHAFVFLTNPGRRAWHASRLAEQSTPRLRSGGLNHEAD